MGITYITVKLIEKKRFSNKRFSIDVELYEHQMARVFVNCKKFFRGKKCYRPAFSFDDCLRESVHDYLATLKGLHMDKVARQWLRKVMMHCMEGLLNPDRSINWDKVDEKDKVINHKSQTTLKLGVKHLQTIKRHIPMLFTAGNYRMDYMQSNVKYIRTMKDNLLSFPFPQQIKSFVWKIRYQRRMHEVGYTRFFIPASILLHLIKELSESFYQQIEKERTLDDCDIEMEYVWFHGEKPELEIRIEDRTYTAYRMPY